MVVFPPCKINLGLQIIRKRDDGYHELNTVFYPVGWCDVLELIEGGDEPFTLTLSGLPVKGDIKTNLCYKAWELIAADFPLPKLKAHLHKVVPMGAGLGGGSSDGAFMLKLINDVCELMLTDKQLLAYASTLGSDCAFFIDAKPAIAMGRGEMLSEIHVDLKDYYMLIVMPDVTVNTAEAYSWVTPKEPQLNLAEIINLPVELWQGKLINDFEKPVSAMHTVIQGLIEKMQANGAVYSSMSGSGAAVYGIFTTEPDQQLFAPFRSWVGLL